MMPTRRTSSAPGKRVTVTIAFKGRAGRLGLLALGLSASSLVLSACITGNVASSGSGTVLVTWDGAAQLFNGSTGDVIELCSADAIACDPSNALFSYLPAEGDIDATLTAGTEVRDASWSVTTLPAGSYSLQVTRFLNIITPTNSPIGDLLRITVSGSGGDRTIWWNSIERTSAADSCESGWSPSWAQWPRDGAGGYVCNKQVYAYYPNDSVPEPGTQADGAPWLQSVSRDSAEASCPDGYGPSWAQWPGNGAGGYVCNLVSRG
jgi:hypothetical protein